jgi:hypothetical protein
MSFYIKVSFFDLEILLSCQSLVVKLTERKLVVKIWKKISSSSSSKTDLTKLEWGLVNGKRTY